MKDRLGHRAAGETRFWLPYAGIVRHLDHQHGLSAPVAAFRANFIDGDSPLKAAQAGVQTHGRSPCSERKGDPKGPSVDPKGV
jgi:hypothetical protein